MTSVLKTISNADYIQQNKRLNPRPAPSHYFLDLALKEKRFHFHVIMTNLRAINKTACTRIPTQQSGKPC